MEPSNSSKGEPQFDHYQANTNTFQTSNNGTKLSSVIDLKSPNLLPALPKRPRKRILLSALGVGATVLSIVGIRWWQYEATHQDTNDAYVTGHIHPVNSRISGTVTQVLVDDNQIVTQGELLVQLDPRDYQVALQQAQASLAAARHQADVAQVNIGVAATNAQGQTTSAQGNIDAAAASISTSEAALAEAQAGVPAAQANLAQVEADLVKAKLDYDRYTNLVQEGASPQQQLDAAKASYDALLAKRNALQEQIRQAQARVVQAQKNLDNAQAKLAATRGTLEQANSVAQQTEANRRQYKAAQSAIDQASAEVKNAQLQLSYTRILAPTAGKIGNKTVEVGQRLQPGQTLMAVVQEQPWIVANFKETQLGKMQPGQEVEIRIDSFSQHPFKGKVDSLSPASGAKFALLPPDNATGNFTKIVQRLPVKIVFDPESIKGYESRIAPGLSAVVSVETH
jgi:membrane fusion protein (multidrug efflux system)